MKKSFKNFVKENTKFVQTWIVCIWVLLVILSSLIQSTVIAYFATIGTIAYFSYITLSKQSIFDSKKDPVFNEYYEYQESILLKKKEINSDEEYYNLKEIVLKYFALFKAIVVYHENKSVTTYHLVENKEQFYVIKNNEKPDEKIYDAFDWGSLKFEIKEGETLFYTIPKDLINNNIKKRLQFFKRNRITISNDILWFYNIFEHDYSCIPVSKLRTFNKYPSQGIIFKEAIRE